MQSQKQKQKEKSENLLEWRQSLFVQGQFGEKVEKVMEAHSEGDTVVLAEIIKKIKEGKMMWIAGGTHLTSTCHVRNVVEGMIKESELEASIYALQAAERGKSGEIYFLTDGKPLPVKEFFTKYVGTQGVDTSGVKGIPYWLARVAAAFGQVPLPALKLLGMENLLSLLILKEKNVQLTMLKLEKKLGMNHWFQWRKDSKK